MINTASGKAGTSPSTSRFLVDKVWFSRLNRQNVAESLEAWFASKPHNNFVCVSNVHTTVSCRTDSRLLDIQNASFLTIADGQPVILYGKVAGVRGIERVMGPDIMTEVFSSELCADRRHFFLGGMPKTLEAMEKNLLKRWPRLRIAGMHSPPFREMTPEEADELQRKIVAAKADYIWVCLGAPKQEYWMRAHHARYPDSLLIGIGAGFAYHAGELKRAPILLQKLACEWVWRLMQDPGRLWKRYLTTNPVFLALFARRAGTRLLFGK